MADFLEGYEDLDRSGRISEPLTHRRSVNKFLLHTTEGNGSWEDALTTLDNNESWSHFLIARTRSGVLRKGQLLPLDIAARSLKSADDHSFSRDGVIQVEVGARADNPFTNDAELTVAVRELIADVRAAIPTIPDTVAKRADGGAVAYPGESGYGAFRPQRLGRDEFLAAEGILGHCHAPAPNKHWDPGIIDPFAVLGGDMSVARSVRAGRAPIVIPEDLVLFPGDTGDAVKRLQDVLNTWLAKQSVDERLVTDGEFGSHTKAAVAFLQLVGGILPVDTDLVGIAGPTTRSKLRTETGLPV